MQADGVSLLSIVEANYLIDAAALRCPLANPFPVADALYFKQKYFKMIKDIAFKI
jgi:hypothetical protein